MQGPADSLPGRRPVGILAIKGMPAREADRALLRTFANHAALALERAQLRDVAVRERVVRELVAWAQDFPVTTVGTIPSPLPGRDGNEEFLWLLQKK